MDYGHLYKYQRRAYRALYQFLQDGTNGVITIHGENGTGKTFLLTVFASDYDNPGELKFLVFTEDQARISEHASTYESFNQTYLRVTSREVVEMCEATPDSMGQLFNLLVYARRFDPGETKIIMGDTYTMIPPVMLLLYCILSLKYGLHLIFAGNIMQLGPIFKSVCHDEKNFHLIEVFDDGHDIDLTIDKSVLPAYKDKLSRFYTELRKSANVKFQFNLRYTLFSLFREKYFAPERFDTVYIASTHRQLTQRLVRFIEHLKSRNETWYEEPLHNGDQAFNPNDKFYPRLLLVVGSKYVHIDKKGVQSIVRLEEIVFTNETTGRIDFLRVRFLKNNRIEDVYRESLNNFQTLQAYHKWLLESNIGVKDKLPQFPLRPYMLLYHATLGETIENESIELDVDCKFGHYGNFSSFVYIALCCVDNESMIQKIHCSKDIESYILTYYMETRRNDTEYYYRCPKKNPDNICRDLIDNGDDNGTFIDGIRWTEVDSVSEFEKENQNDYVRIKREAYRQPRMEQDTELMRIVRFIKDNPDVICNTIENVPSLREKYDRWIEQSATTSETNIN